MMRAYTLAVQLREVCACDLRLMITAMMALTAVQNTTANISSFRTTVLTDTSLYKSVLL